MVGHLFVVGSACVLSGGLSHDWLIIILFHGLSQVGESCPVFGKYHWTDWQQVICLTNHCCPGI